ncbi:VWA domain-containing protein [Sporosarcina koreensis]|uniref:VWA domain-containing protein n=1 Tax=Sporosarcina koreensis TaxID=334735 RepID=A0ABW0TT75_9BACL
MANRKVCEENRSVLNTDAFDRRRFKEILEISPRLQKVRDEAILPKFEPLLGDIWASFFKMKPTIIANDSEEFLSVNKTIMEIIMADEQFSYFRNFTRLNDLTSAISTIVFGEKINDWFVQLVEQDADLQEQACQFQLLVRQSRNQQLPESGRVALIELNAKLQQTVQSNSESLLQVIDRARHEAKHVKEGLISLLGGLSAGNAEAELKKVPLRDKIRLAEKIASTKKMKEIADWAGRFKQIARSKQKSKKGASPARKGVTFGNDIENLLPVELCYYTHPVMKTDFLRRFSEMQTMQFERGGPEVLKKGPIVLCLDQSDSMSGLDSQSKGFALALMSIARKQRRDLCLIVFSSRIQTFKYVKGKICVLEMMKLAQTFLRGGTNFESALTEALSVISESRFKQADVVFITDGEDHLTTSFLASFHKKKREKAFNVLSLVIGCNRNTVAQFSDRVITVEEFDDEGSYTAFEL